MTFAAWRVLIKRKTLATNNQFVLAVVQNVLIMVRYSALKDQIVSQSTPEWARQWFFGKIHPPMYQITRTQTFILSPVE